MKIFGSLNLILSFIFISSIILPLGFTISIISNYYRTQMEGESVQSISNTLESISDNIMSYLSDIETLATIPYANKNIMEAIIAKTGNGGKDGKSDQVLNEMLLKYLKMLRKEILSIVIVNDNGSVLYYNRNQNVTLNPGWNFREQGWYRKARETDGEILYIGGHVPFYFTFSDSLTVFSLVRKIKHPYISASPGVLLVDADTELFRDMFKDIWFGSDSFIVLLDDTKNILYSSGPLDDCLLEGLRANYGSMKIKNAFYRVTYKTIQTTGWKLAVLVSDKEVQEKIRLFYLTGLLTAGLTFFAMFFFFRFLTRYYIIHPIQDMSRVMKAVEGGNLDLHCSPKGRNEIAYLGRRLNIMVEELGKLINREYKLVISQKKAEYRALQAQIQPHFLYNTMTGLLGLNRLGERKLLEESILNLTGMLRYSLGADGKAASTLLDELMFIEKYCRLQKIRFEERLSVRITCEREIENFRIPRLLVQPLVENAVIHNVDVPDRVCVVEVAARKITIPLPAVEIRVLDNGVGFDVNSVNGKGLGIQNVRERLMMGFPDSRFDIRSRPGEGTVITLTIPENGSDTRSCYEDTPG